MVLSVRQKVDKLYDRLNKLQKKLVELQDECTHPNVEKQYKADTGNWDRGDDSYWINFTCHDCRKRWMEDQ